MKKNIPAIALMTLVIGASYCAQLTRQAFAFVFRGFRKAPVTGAGQPVEPNSHE
jgi:hypothetical protein